MIPNRKYITINNNKKLLTNFIRDIFILPRKLGHRWSKITNQTPNIKLGYPAQHLASLILGMKGKATAARGDDIVDGTEVKACNRIDQVDTCIKCKEHVLRIENTCNCGATGKEIKRNNDSKWLFPIKSKADLKRFKSVVPRVLLILLDYPDFKIDDFQRIRIQSFELWPKSSRQKNLIILLNNYYNNIYLKNRKANPDKTPAPKNFWPHQYQFYMCNPIKTFECIASDLYSIKPNIVITHYVEPSANRNALDSELMPKTILRKKEIKIFKDLTKEEFITEKMRARLKLRPD